MSAPVTVSASLLASRLVKRAPSPAEAAAWRDATEPALADQVKRTVTQCNASTVIDIALRLGWSRRQRELEAVAIEAGRAFSAGLISESDYAAIRGAQDRRRGQILHKAEMHHLRYGPPRRPGYDRTASKDRRRGLLRLGVVPDWLGNVLTPGEEAVATVILQDIQATGACDKTNGEIAQLAGCCERLVIRTKNNLDKLRDDFELTRRPKLGRRHDTTIILCRSERLRVWLRDKRPQRRGVGERRVCDLQSTSIDDTAAAADARARRVDTQQRGLPTKKAIEFADELAKIAGFQFRALPQSWLDANPPKVVQGWLDQLSKIAAAVGDDPLRWVRGIATYVMQRKPPGPIYSPRYFSPEVNRIVERVRRARTDPLPVVPPRRRAA